METKNINVKNNFIYEKTAIYETMKQCRTVVARDKSQNIPYSLAYTTTECCD